MRAYNPIETLAEAIYSATLRDLPGIEYESKTIEQRKNNLPGELKKRRPDQRDITIRHFPQIWGSTALGFGGMGGASMSEAYTTIVFLNNTIAAVYFGGGFAYSVMVNEVFMKDVTACRAGSISDAQKNYEVISTRSFNN